MRTVVVAARLVLSVFLPLVLPIAGSHLAQAADARIILSPEADYPDFDLKTLKGVTIDACSAACLGDDQCRAFTFNTKAGWCFLKSDFGTLVATPGATAGRKVETVELTPSLEEKRIGELSFVSAGFIDEARQLAGALRRRYDPENGAFQALRDAGGVAYKAGNYQESIKLFGQALAVADDNPGLWLDFAIANYASNPDTYSDKQAAYTNITAAGINAYIRSEDDGNRAQALALIGDGFRLREIWKPSYLAYRASLALHEDADIRATYDKVIAEHGFRILSHEVDSDSANPRICVVFSDNLPVSRPGLTDYIVVRGGEGLAVEPSDRQICVDGVKHGGRYHVTRARRIAVERRRDPRASRRDRRLCPRPRAVGRLRRQCLCAARRARRLDPAHLGQHQTRRKRRSTGSATAASPMPSATDNSSVSLRLTPPSTSPTRAARRSGRARSSITSELNKTMTTAIPIAEAVPSLKPGVYVDHRQGRTDARQDDYDNLATQWFVVSDLGLTALSGDGRRPRHRALAVERAAGRRRQAPPRRHQQRRPRRSDDRCQRLRQIRSRASPAAPAAPRHSSSTPTTASGETTPSSI